MIITRTPVRIPLGGGGTDLPSYSSKFGGFLVSAAIDKYTFITVNRRKLDRLIRASYSQTEIVDSPDRLQHPIIREALRLLGIDGGVEITSIADMPAGSGSGTSASFAVGLLHALHALKREHVPPVQLAEEACRIEIDVLGEPIGKHDQYITALGGITCLDIDRTGHVSAFPARMDEDVVEEFEGNLLLFYTGVVRRTADVLAAQDQAAHRSDPRVIESLHRIKDLGWEIKGALEAGKLRRFGELMDAHWEVKKQLSGSVSGSQFDRWYDLARQAGAIGGKLMGAGGGGFFLFYCENGAKAALREAMAREGLLELRFRLDFEGTKVLVNF
jgi:D-glycero-alpha-D-manno-heptose-7-phosphate kinase